MVILKLRCMGCASVRIIIMSSNKSPQNQGNLDFEVILSIMMFFHRSHSCHNLIRNCSKVGAEFMFVHMISLSLRRDDMERLRNRIV